MDSWKELKWWKSGECDVIQEKLNAMDHAKQTYCPHKLNIFKALEATPYNKVKVCLMGQDPYPNPRYATGLAFSIPPGVVPFPPTLQEIINEYKSDLELPGPRSGCLEAWANRGVLLWNVIPTCYAWKSLSHDWPEWETLTQEIVATLSRRGVVFCALGAKARKYLHPQTEVFEGGFEKIVYETIDPDHNRILEFAHPCPRNKINKDKIKNPFYGSKMFTRINTALGEIGHEQIEWKL